MGGPPGTVKVNPPVFNGSVNGMCASGPVRRRSRPTASRSIGSPRCRWPARTRYSPWSAANGDTANKIGTFSVATLARAFGIPFYVAAPVTTFDLGIKAGDEIPIEQRSAEEQSTMTGRTADGRIETVQVVPDGSPVANYGFDVTPARLVTGLITERGVLKASREGLQRAFPERAGPGRGEGR